MGHVSCKGICSENTVWSQHTHTHTHTYTLWTLVFFHHALMLWDEVSGLAGSPGPANESNAVLFLCFCLPRSLSLSFSHTHTLIDLLSSYSLSCSRFLPLLGWQFTPNKMEFGTFAETAELPLNCNAASKCQYVHCRLGSFNDDRARWGSFIDEVRKNTMETKTFYP